MNLLVRPQRRVGEVGFVTDGAFVFAFAILGFLVRGCMQLHTLLCSERFSAFAAGERVVVDHDVIAD